MTSMVLHYCNVGRSYPSLGCALRSVYKVSYLGSNIGGSDSVYQKKQKTQSFDWVLQNTLTEQFISK